jgi:hypothetical protein
MAQIENCIAQSYSAELRGGKSDVRFPAGPENFSFHHRVHADSGAHSASYPMSIREFFPGGKAAVV